LAAFQEKSYEVARRWVMEALAHNRQHAGARALMARLDAARSASPFQAPAGSEVVSTDPTVLIGRASRSAPVSEGIEPTVMVRRDQVGHRPADTDPRVSFPPLPPRSSSRSTSEPTMVGQSRGKSASSRPKSSFSLGAALQSLGAWLQRGNDRHPRSSSAGRKGSTGSGLSSPGARGAMLALGTVVVGALLVWILFAAVRWVFPAGQLLTITKPTGGTILGPGIECGTGGSRCSASVKSGEAVELEPRPDKDYVFSGYTGDCAPAGRTSMTEPRTCGATFDPVAAPAAAVTFRLTIAKPEGGTVVGNGGIYCGTNGAMCSADIPSGVPVSLKAESDDGFSFQQFTGDCPSTGEMTMTSAKACGATFVKSLSPMNANPVRPPTADNFPRPKPKPAPQTATAPPAPPVANPGPSPTKPNPSGGTPTSPTGTPTDPGKPAAAPKTAEEHAKEEIGQLVNNYCLAMQSLKPSAIRPLFHLDNEREFKDKFKEYKALQCTVTAPPTFDRLDPNAAGGAQVKFGMKQVVKMASGGAPETIETIVTMVVSRKDFQSPWLIDRISHEPKPK
jgi:List-Bact-rpt repeat protein